MKLKGIDVSHHQGEINWKQVSKMQQRNAPPYGGAFGHKLFI